MKSFPMPGENTSIIPIVRAMSRCRSLRLLVRISILASPFSPSKLYGTIADTELTLRKKATVVMIRIGAGFLESNAA